MPRAFVIITTVLNLKIGISIVDFLIKFQTHFLNWVYMKKFKILSLIIAISTNENFKYLIQNWLRKRIIIWFYFKLRELNS